MNVTGIAFLVAGGAFVASRAIAYARSPTLAATKYYKGGFLPQMTRWEARKILGINPSATEERVKEAHRRIMIANHPDRGGSGYLAGKINEAKDICLGKKVPGDNSGM